MKTLYQIVSTDGAQLLTAEELAARYDVSELETGTHLRPELRGQPRIKGLCGPMWGGHYDGDANPVYLKRDGEGRETYGSQEPIEEIHIRYETWEAYELYSR